MSNNIRVAAATLAIILIASTSAQAIDKCKVKVDKKTGVLVVSAKGVSGTLQWGAAEGAETEPFFNAGVCVVAGKAKKCEIADPATLAAKTPPSGCTLYLDDDTAPCSVWIAGCTPGGRNPDVCVPNPSASPRYVDNGDGTVSDRTTCLMWEQKTGTPLTGNIDACPGFPTCGSVHDVNNRYRWTTGAPYNPDGPAFFDFLAELNGPSPFAGHDDWRLPTITETEGILLDPGANGCGVVTHCIDPVFGPSHANLYWSSSTYQDTPDTAWSVEVFQRDPRAIPKSLHLWVRAVRTGS